MDIETQVRQHEEQLRSVTSWLRTELGFDTESEGRRWTLMVKLARRVRRLMDWRIRVETETASVLRRFEDVERTVKSLTISRARLLGALAAAASIGGAIQWALGQFVR